MELKKIWMVSAMMLLLISEWKSSNGCLDREKIALLKLRPIFEYQFPSEFNPMVDWGHNSDCCQWNGVICDNSTKNVIKLDLSPELNYNFYDWYYDSGKQSKSSWYIHLTMFLPFKKLQALSMSWCRITGFFKDEGLERLSQLEYLDLSYNKFNNNTLTSLSALSTLKNLNLSYNDLEGMLYFEDFKNFASLKYLDLRGYYRIEAIKGSERLSQLEYLDLSFNNFNNNTLASLSDLSTLKNLSLSGNDLQGTLYLEDFSNFKKLEFLDMSYSTSLNSKFLQSIQDMNALKVLRLTNSTLNGTLLSASQGLCNSRYLQVLDLGFNNFTGTLPACLANLTSLQTLSLSYNQITGDVAFLANLTSLQTLYLYGNQITGDVACLANLTSLQTLYLSDNQITGDVACLANLTSLQTLGLYHNQITGDVACLANLTSLQFLDLSYNQITGDVACLANLTSLTSLDISSNSLSGPLPKWMGKMSYLWNLKMSKNHLEGPIPLEFCQLKYLQALDLSENDISGMIPSCFNPPHIQAVRLSKNKLQGTLEHALSRSSSLELLDLGNNQLTGSIPNWIHRHSLLNFLLLNNNNLGGEIPIQLCQVDHLSLINLSHNDLYGTIPDCLRITSIEEQNGIDVVEDPCEVPNADAPAPTTASGPSTGTFGPATALGPATFAPSQDVTISTHYVTIDDVEFPTKRTSYDYQGEILNMMSGIDLSCNKFFGEIPPQLGNLNGIRALNLSHNNLSGSIPPTFGNLKQVESLDLSDNLLTGKIPPELGGLSSIGVFSVANNNLSGEIPTTTQFTTFNESNFQGNPLLCGAPLPKSCNDRGPESPRALVDHGEDGGFMDMECFYASFGASYLTVLLGLVAVLLINPYWLRWWFYHIEKWTTSSYYFVVDNLPKRFFP